MIIAVSVVFLSITVIIGLLSFFMRSEWGD